MTDTTNIDRELGWDDEIEKDSSSDFTLLPAGEYPFEVVDFARERYNGGEKLPPCNMAIVGIKIDGGVLGNTTINERLFLHTKTEGILCAFFTSIGQRQHGDKVKMNWGTVIGSKGRAKFGIRKYEKDGEPREINQVKRWLEPADESPQAGSYTPGAF